jgi:hypothetical protein
MLLQSRTYDASDDRVIVGDHNADSAVTERVGLCVHLNLTLRKSQCANRMPMWDALL